jgi:hypothetical protein
MNKLQQAVAYTIAMLGMAALQTHAGENRQKMEGPYFTQSEPITNGFLFVEGEYIELPYIVSKKDRAVCVNGKVLFDYAPMLREPPVTPRDRPALPVTVNSNSKLFDSDLKKYLRDMELYLISKHTPSEVADLMEQVVTKLPCVKNIKRRDPETSHRVEVTFFNGDIINMMLFPILRKPAITPATVDWHVSRGCEDYARNLKEGVFFSLSNQGGRKYSFSSDVAKSTLPSILAVVNSEMTDDEKAKQLATLLGMSAAPKEKSLFVKRLKDSKQFAERVEQLKAKQP